MIKNMKIQGKILLKSGTRIGGNDVGVKIGGIDSPVIKNSLNNEPYIPGSSLKGKMRFLLEHSHDLVKTGDVSTVGLVAEIFGTSAQNITASAGMTRVIFRDAAIYGAYPDYVDDVIDSKKIITKDEATHKLGSTFSEAKTEVVIDRISGAAKNGGLRIIERVPAGTVFDFEIVLRVLDGDDENKGVKLLKEGLKLVENDALGGSGSRGSGHIKFFALTLDDVPFELKEGSR